MELFPAEDMVIVSTIFNRALYAQLKQQEFQASCLADPAACHLLSRYHGGGFVGNCAGVLSHPALFMQYWWLTCSATLCIANLTRSHLGLGLGSRVARG